MWFMIKIRNNNDLLILKVYGYSNLKIFFILALTSFILGCVILTIVSPITSSMVRYYEITKSQHARDIDHLVTFNRNGLWIKEPLKNGNRIISAESIEGTKLKSAIIFNFNNKNELEKKIFSKSINISSKTWFLKNVIIFQPADGVFKKNKQDEIKILSLYDIDKITSLLAIQTQYHLWIFS